MALLEIVGKIFRQGCKNCVPLCDEDDEKPTTEDD